MARHTKTTSKSTTSTSDSLKKHRGMILETSPGTVIQHGDLIRIEGRTGKFRVYHFNLKNESVTCWGPVGKGTAQWVSVKNDTVRRVR